ncbi:hypothetical protein J2790_001885 [Paenarthrobacter nicotinovorans]|nr:hypothetical protein [Paenarthrobacter nicotinovorans]SCZ56683.1 hypothetical protein SAMN02799638_01930 [Arthrobacter sp. UNCCL28]
MMMSGRGLVGTAGEERTLLPCRVVHCGSRSSASSARQHSWAKIRVWTMSTLSTPDCLVHPSDCPGFRMFPPLPSNAKARNPVRVPPRARHTPSSEGVFALTCAHACWSGSSDMGRGVCLAPRVAFLVVGERVQGLGWFGPPCAGATCSSLTSRLGWRVLYITIRLGEALEEFRLVVDDLRHSHLGVLQLFPWGGSTRHIDRCRECTLVALSTREAGAKNWR